MVNFHPLLTAACGWWGSSYVTLHPLSDAQLGAPRAGVALDLLVGRGDRLARDDLKPRLVIAHTARRFRRADAIARLLPHEVLNNAVLQRMEADNRQPAARLEQAHGLRQRALQRAEFVVDRDAQRLKRARRRVDALPRARHGSLDDLRQLARLPDRPRLHDRARHPP